ncbi:MAG: peptidyl-prolyl cis-trans isomerase [Gemmatimonadaceae bacterium]|nr:peptidyl-prolyl cis-trans isomerase [Gemmatimonadaceae bacterium]
MLQAFRASSKYVFWIIAVAFIGGFLFFDSSGLFSRDTGPTLGTAVATVEGTEISYGVLQRAVEQKVQEQEGQAGRSLTLDERKRVENDVFDELVAELLLQKEYEKRGITVTTDEIVNYARFSPPPQFAQLPDFQTNGRFDLERYQRFLRSPQARQQGLLAQLEAYYRNEIPKQKLFEQVAAGAWISDARLWQVYRDRNDSVQASYVALRPNTVDMASVSDADARTWYEAHKADYERPGRAALSVLTIPRTITAADTAATRDSILALKAQIAAASDPKAKFAELAELVSTDSGSARNGGQLGPSTRGQFVPPFETAAYALPVGGLSEPVQTQFGWHLLRLDARRGDTLELRHILLPVQQNEAAARATDRRADSLARIAGDPNPRRLDSIAKALGLPVTRGIAFEGEPMTIAGRYIPSASAWAFDGATVGEISEMTDDESGYYIARLDSIQPKGIAPFETVKDEIKERLAAEKVLDTFMELGRAISTQAQRDGLEAAARARALTVETTGMFTRTSPAEGLGAFNEAVGAAFALPTGVVSAPIRTRDGVFVMRVDKRVEAQRSAFEAQKAAQRQQLLGAVRQQMVRDFLEGLRKGAKVDDRRANIRRAERRAST